MLKYSSLRSALPRVFMILVLAAMLTAWASAAAPRPGEANQGSARFEPAPCMFAAVPGLLEGENVECGYLIVPEEYERPDGPTIRLAVVVLKAQSENPAPDPIVMMQGGPGGSTIDFYTQTIPFSPRIWNTRDIVLFDQRGTLYSEPALTCPEYDELALETLDDDLSIEESNRMYQESLRACRERLVNQGINLSAFDSRESAADVEALRTALGYEQINLYGVSYGTLLAQHVMRYHPEGLRTVTLDGVVPADAPMFNNGPRLQNRAFEQLFEACAEDAGCNEAYPNLRQVFYDTVDRLNAEPVFVTLRDMETGQDHRALLDGDSLIGAVFQMLYITEMIPFLPRVIYDARANNFDLVERVLSLLVFDRTFSLGMYYTINCAEDSDVTPNPDDLADLPPQIAAIEKDSVQRYLESCAIWDVETLEGEIDAPVESDIPTLILSGAFDPVTPSLYAEQVAARLPNSYAYVFPWGAHGAVTKGECQDQVFNQFLNNPSSAPDAACITAAGEVTFYTPGSLVRLPVLVELLSLEGTRWIEMLVYGLALVVLSGALIVYPLVWFIRLLSGKPSPRPELDRPYLPQEYEFQQNERPLLYRLAPWLSAGAALALLGFTVILLGVVITMVNDNDIRYLVGLPGSARPAFLLPPIAALLALLMLGGVITAWANRAGSAWGRIYLTLITLAALTCVGILAFWGMLTAFAI